MICEVESYPGLPHLWRRHENGVWYIVWQYAGKPMRRSTGEKKYVRAQGALAAFVESGRHSAPDRARLTVGDAARRWLEARSGAASGLAPRTLAEYARTVERLSRAPLARVRLNAAGPEDVRLFLRHLERRERLPSAALARSLTHLRMLWGWLERQELAGRNPARLVDTPKHQAERARSMTPAGWAQLQADLAADLAAAPDAEQARERQMLADLLAFLWGTGLRSIEASGGRLRWADLDLEAATLTVRSPANKGGTVMLPLAEDLVPMLRARLLQGGAGPFPSEWPMRNAWRRFQARAPEWKGWSLHAFRHGFVTRIRAAHGDAAAAFLARHRSRSMTEHYSHFDAETFRAALG